MAEFNPSLASANLRKPPLPQSNSDKIRWGNLPGSALSFAIAQASRAWASVSLVICSSNAEADLIENEIQIFNKGAENAPTVLHFTDWETLPYDTFSPHQDIISERIRTLYNLGRGEKCIIVTSAQTLLQRISPKSYIETNSLVLKVGDTLKQDAFRKRLSEAGYQNVETVYQHGEMAVRGALLDVFPMGSDSAFRIELFDDEIESIRTFDPETQRTIEAVTNIDVLPAKECPLDQKAIAQFKNKWFEYFDEDPKSCPVYQDVVSGLSPAGVEYFLPLFFEQSATLFDYLPEDTCTFIVGKTDEAIESFWRELLNRYESRQGDRLRPILPPNKLFLAANELYSALKPMARVSCERVALEEKKGQFNFACQAGPELQIDAKAQNPLFRLEAFLCENDWQTLFCAESSGRREALLDQLQKIGVTPTALNNAQELEHNKQNHLVTVAPLQSGFIDVRNNVAIISEAQLFGIRIQQRKRRKNTSDEQDNVVKNLTELKVGAPVVHIENGVGRYLGLQTIGVDGQDQEFLVLQYANDAKLYVPVSNLHFISRYSGSDPDMAPLHKLGSDHWQKAKRKAAEQIRDVAAELLEIYAKREAKVGTSFEYPKGAYELFSASFPFEETPDQEQAIEAVRQDMLSTKPMDRLVCGDVGFGKTEVAMRAAFIAVQNNRQVIVLVPTTLLAQQHFDNFQDRFADWPVNIEVISRFRSSKETSSIKSRLQDGKVDILIGTHKLLQGDIKFPNLGLLIIDEEHRFGVRQKEVIKSIRAEVDILTLTATPIPRTLNMAMNGIRDLSIIATPPAKRLSVKTFVRESEQSLLKEAILREIMRGGQVYYLHNEVKTIEKTARELGELIPEARIQIGHGQMRERELEAVMSDFYHKRFNVLVCTTIIETGIDVPSANTIIIERADKFGLAQLHQLRGRVGRSHHQAYAYLLTPNVKAMTADAHKRLAAIAEAQDLGAGFMLASHDLEIRGAGELLGEEQSGQIQAIGFSLYMDMLEKAVKAFQNGEELDLNKPINEGIEINLRIPALIPDDYLPDVHTRLIMYKRLSSVRDNDELDEFQVEMIDRFGLLPEATKNLISVTRLKMAAEPLGIEKIEANDALARIEFNETPKVDPLKIVLMVQKQPQIYQLEGATRLKYIEEMKTPKDRINKINTLLQSLAS